MRRHSCFLLACLLPLGCASPDAEASIEGRVLDAMTGRPVAGATLSARDELARTDAAGRYVLSSASRGRPLRVEAPRYFGADAIAAGGELLLYPEAPDEALVDAYLERLGERQLLRDDPRDPALRPEAAALIRGEALGSPAIEGEVGAARAALTAPPETIRVWRRRLDDSTSSCEGRVDVIPFEDYVKGVLPHEWVPSWNMESLLAGSLAIRTYAWRWIARGGKYACADLDDTSASQVYREERLARTDRAVDGTRGRAIVRDGALVSGSYSAENGDPTANGVEDPLCAGREVSGHGRGMCQRGSERWAVAGNDHVWIAEHYYPGAIVSSAEPEPPAVALDAELVSHAYPETLRAGEEASATIELRNVGSQAWGAGEIVLTGSALRHESWLDERRVVEVIAEPGAVARVELAIRAPEVDEEALVTATFALASSDGTFGPIVTLAILVEPPEELAADAGVVETDAYVPPEREDAGTARDRPHLAGGCSVAPRSAHGSGWLLLAGLALFATRRRADTRARS